MKLAGLFLIAVVGACSAPDAPQAGAVRSPVLSTSPEATAPPPSPFWTLGLGETAISTVDFSCRLPVYVDIGPTIPGGFIDFPSGTVTRDPAAAASHAERPGREVVGYTSVNYYDRAYSRWLPASRNEVSPDGTHYVYTDRATADAQNPSSRATLHVVEVKTGSELTFDGGPWSNPYETLDYSTNGIYLVTTHGAYVGLWLMDATTGALSRVASLLNVQGIAASNAIWVGVINPDDPHPVAGVAPDELDRISLPDGGRVRWFYRPGSSVYYLGQDVDGHPIVFVPGANDPGELRLLLAPGLSQSIWTFGDRVPVPSNPISDRHGIWFGSPDGIFLYTAAHGMQKVSNQSGFPANGCF